MFSYMQCSAMLSRFSLIALAAKCTIRGVCEGGENAAALSNW